MDRQSIDQGRSESLLDSYTRKKRDRRNIAYDKSTVRAAEDCLRSCDHVKQFRCNGLLAHGGLFPVHIVQLVANIVVCGLHRAESGDIFAGQRFNKGASDHGEEIFIGETFIRLETPVRDRNAYILCTMNDPNEKILPMILLAETAREPGARSIGLICPDLAYMRQDKRFKEGEGITSRYFARLLSEQFDWLVTIDPQG